MSDIFISYKREEQATAKKLADALHEEGWSVWWDPKLRAGEHFDDVIEAALKDAKCVIVMWSERSVQSRYVRDEATYALEKEKLVPVAIETVNLPFRFRGVHTLSLLGWDGSKDFPEFRRLIDDIVASIGPSHKAIAAEEEKRRPENEERRKADEERLREQEWQRSTQQAKRKPDEDNRTRIEEKNRAQQEAEQRERRLKPDTVVRDRLKDGSQGPEMVVIAAGTFRMGDGHGFARPVRTVIISPFAVGRYEVTFEEYDRFSAATGSKLEGDKGWGRGQRPVIYVSWYDAVEYAKWLSAQTGKRYRLPTEAEWEYAARSGGKEERWAGTSREQQLGEYAWYTANSGGRTQPVGGKKPNGLGLYDMSGNVSEWVEDCWHENYNGAPTNGSAWKEEGGGDCYFRVIRGGSWQNAPQRLRSSSRVRVSPEYGDRALGFRLARDID